MSIKPMLMITVGAPGSGKSYLAERLCKDYGMVHLRSDEIRDYVYNSPTYAPDEQRRLFTFIDFLAKTFLRHGVGVIYDANFTKRTYRMALKRLARTCGVQFVVLWVQTPLEVAMQRAQRRAFHPVNSEVVLGLHAEIELPKNEPVLIVDGTKSYKANKTLIDSFLRTL